MPTNFSESRALYFFLRVSIFVEHLIISEELRKFPNVYEGVPNTFRKCSEELFQPCHGNGLSSTSEIFGYIYNQSYALFFSHFLIKSLLRLNFFFKKMYQLKWWWLDCWKWAGLRVTRELTGVHLGRPGYEIALTCPLDPSLHRPIVWWIWLRPFLQNCPSPTCKPQTNHSPSFPSRLMNEIRQDIWFYTHMNLWLERESILLVTALSAGKCARKKSPQAANVRNC